MEPNRLLYPGLAIGASQPQNALAPQPTWADAYDYNARAYTDWVARERAKGVELGTIDPQTGWPTKAGYLDAVQQYSNALLMGTTTPRPTISIHPSGTILANGADVGRVKFEHGDQSTRIGDIEVYPSFRNQGIGSATIKQIQEEAAARGNPVVLSTDAFRGKEAQANQRRLYERLGFTPNRGPDAVSERIGKRRVAEELIWRMPDTSP